MNGKIVTRIVEYKDKKTGETKTFTAFDLELENGMKIQIKEDRYNYRAFDYIKEHFGLKQKAS